MSGSSLSVFVWTAILGALPPVEQGAGGPTANSPWMLRLAPEGESGRPLIVSGRLFAADGVTPLPGVTIDVHQTDAEGHYRRNLLGRARLSGELVTGPGGEYEIRTVVPGSYPGRDVPAHVHFKLFGPGVPEQSPDDEWFEGDPLLTPALRERVRESVGRFSPICPAPTDRRGLRRCVRDFRVSP